MDIIEFEMSEKVCITVLVNKTAETDVTPLGDFISSKLSAADIFRAQICGDYSDRDRIIRESYFVTSREANQWYYAMFLIAVSQKDKAISLFNRYGVVVDICKISK